MGLIDLIVITEMKGRLGLLDVLDYHVAGLPRNYCNCMRFPNLDNAIVSEYPREIIRNRLKFDFAVRPACRSGPVSLYDEQ